MANKTNLSMHISNILHDESSMFYKERGEQKQPEKQVVKIKSSCLNVQQKGQNFKAAVCAFSAAARSMYTQFKKINEYCESVPTNKKDSL